MTNRRTFVGTITGGLLAASLDAGAQPPGRLVRVIGWLHLGCIGVGPSSDLDAFRRRLAELGWAEGRNIAIVARSAETKRDLLPDLAAEFVQLGVDVIVTLGTPATKAVRKATARIPIVMAGTDNPVADGLVASLAKPGGNITGLTNNPGPPFYQKMVQLLKDAAPKISGWRCCGLRIRSCNLLMIEGAASTLGLAVVDVAVPTAEQVPNALDTAARAGADALFVFSDPDIGSRGDLIVEFARNKRLPSIGGEKYFVQAGGLLSYWTDWTELRRRTASYVDKILRGAKPADLAVEQLDKFELVINLKTARELGITIPRSLLEQANELLR